VLPTHPGAFQARAGSWLQPAIVLPEPARAAEQIALPGLIPLQRLGLAGFLRFPLRLMDFQGRINSRPAHTLLPPGPATKPIAPPRSRHAKAMLMPWRRIGTSSDGPRRPAAASLADASAGAAHPHRKAVRKLTSAPAWGREVFASQAGERARPKASAHSGPLRSIRHGQRSASRAGASPSLAPWNTLKSRAGSEAGQ